MPKRRPTFHRPTARRETTARLTMNARSMATLAIVASMGAVLLGQASATRDLRASLTDSQVRLQDLEREATQDVPATSSSVATRVAMAETPAGQTLLAHRTERQRTRLGVFPNLHTSAFGSAPLTLADLVGKGRNGQVLGMVNGAIAWADIPTQTLRLQPSSTVTTGYSGSEPSPRRNGGGAPPGPVLMNHESDAGGGILSINRATSGILDQNRGGTGFPSFSTGDLLVGAANGGLSKLALGAAGYVATSSGGTVTWLSPSAVAAAGGWVDDGSVVRLNTNSDSVGIGTSSPAVKLHVVGSGAITGRLAVGKTSALSALDVLGTISGSALVVNGGLTIRGLTYTFPSAHTADGYLKDDGNGALSWATLPPGFGSGQVIAVGDNRYLKKSGGTMTGALAIQNGNSHTPTATPLLSVRGTISGSLLTISAGGTSSLLGNLAIGKTTSTAKLDIVGTISGALITQNGAGSNYFLGNVGIGTASPSSKVQINEGDSNGSQLRLTNTRAGGNSFVLGVGDNGSTSSIVQPGAFFLYSINGAATAMTILSTGNVGIGKSLPAAKLDVQGTMSGTGLQINGTSRLFGVALVNTNTATNATQAYRMQINDTGLASSDPDSGTLFLQSTTAPTSAADIGSALTFGGYYTGTTGGSWARIRGPKTNNTDGNYSGYLAFDTRTSGAGFAEKMRIENAGNIGVATTSPHAKFDVVGTISGSLLTLSNPTGTNYALGNFALGKTTSTAKLDVIGTISGSALTVMNGASYLMGNVGVGTTVANAQLTLGGAGPTIQFGRSSTASENFHMTVEIPDSSSRGLTFWNGNYGAGVQIISFKANGNVGIGLTVPRTKLEVRGTVSGATVLGSHGITTNVVAAACDDTTAQATNGTICIDSADGAAGRIYYRFGGAWHYAAGTAGFQVPNIIDPATGLSEVSGMGVGDLVIGKINEQLGDGALHGLWVKFDMATEVGRALHDHPELLASLPASASSSSVPLSDLQDMVVQGALAVYGSSHFFGSVSIDGTLALSRQQLGTATILVGETKVAVRYDAPFAVAPTVSATPLGLPTTFWGITAQSMSGFTIELATPAMAPLTFSWIAIPATSGATSSMSTSVESSSASSASDAASSASSSSSTPASIPFPVDAAGVPVSSSEVWNNCLRDIPTFDADGRPLNCSRYHDANTWQHPDLGITFVWNDTVTPPYLQLPEGYAAMTETDAPSSVSSSSTASSAEPTPDSTTGADLLPVDGGEASSAE
jgi:hypothetical protein